MNLLDQPRVSQLISTYGPDQPPQLPLGFGDYLSILWRLDRATDHQGRNHYYRACAITLADALGLKDTPLDHLIRNTKPGKIYKSLPLIPEQQPEGWIDTTERQAAIGQLVKIRLDVLAMSAYEESWDADWPGSGIAAADLRERIGAVLFTALPSQYLVFARLLVVVDIVLQELLTGSRKSHEVDLETLVKEFNYPDPNDPDVKLLFQQERLP